MPCGREEQGGRGAGGRRRQRVSWEAGSNKSGECVESASTTGGPSGGSSLVLMPHSVPTVQPPSRTKPATLKKPPAQGAASAPAPTRLAQAHPALVAQQHLAAGRRLAQLARHLRGGGRGDRWVAAAQQRAGAAGHARQCWR